MMRQLLYAIISVVSCSLFIDCHAQDSKAHYLLETEAQIKQMRAAIAQDGSFGNTYSAQVTAFAERLRQGVDVPTPQDAGGGYTHEKHKKNYTDMRMAGRLYLLSGDEKYLSFVTQHLDVYAEMYASLPLHPKQKEQSPGKLFWQSLNEAVWLVNVIQAFDAIKGALSQAQIDHYEKHLFTPIVTFLSEQQPQTFNKIHNHGTWAVAAVGMTGYVFNNASWVEKALFGLALDGNGGFLRQLDELFSPQGYYNEGPYYQRYALMPFVLFAQAIQINEPERKIFEYRENIIQKAIDTALQLSYNGLFFGINDAIKDKGIDTVELVHGVAIAYDLKPTPGLIDIAKKQDNVLLTGYGFNVAKAIDEGRYAPFDFKSQVFGDGKTGDQGALIVFRSNQDKAHQALVFKPTSQGLGHGHFDKLHWMFFNAGKEVVYDYGAARFLNVEAKYGGHYLPENKSYAKQTIAHNTLVVNETSHFAGKTATGNDHYPEILFTEIDEHLQIASAREKNAYPGVEFVRTQGLVTSDSGKVFLLDIVNVEAKAENQYDLPLHFHGQFIESNLRFTANTQNQSVLGQKNGYQHLWLQAQASVEQGLSKITWLLDNTFYTYSTHASPDREVLMVRIGANDPNFNLIANQGFIQRVKSAKNTSFVSVLEVHGEYNGRLEYTKDAQSLLRSIEQVEVSSGADISAYNIRFVDNENYQLLINHRASSDSERMTVSIDGKSREIVGFAELLID